MTYASAGAKCEVTNGGTCISDLNYTTNERCTFRTNQPLFASATLGGLYLLIKYTDLNPGTLYQFFACLFALLATSDLLQPLLGLAATGELGLAASTSVGVKKTLGGLVVVAAAAWSR